MRCISSRATRRAQRNNRRSREFRAKIRNSISPGRGSTADGETSSCSTCGMLTVPNGGCYK